MAEIPMTLIMASLRLAICDVKTPIMDHGVFVTNQIMIKTRFSIQ